MSQSNILAIFTDGSAMIYEPNWSVRIVNRGPSPVRQKDFEQVSRHPPEWVGFVSVEARVLATEHRVQTHRGLVTVERVERDIDAPPGDAASYLQAG